LEPLFPGFKDSKWGNRDSIYEYSAGIGSLPDKYKNGNPFYFTVSNIDSNLVHTMNCSIPKYYVAINTYSDSGCTQSDQ
jgi:hypothetical protein